jgi:hypothetical protein
MKPFIGKLDAYEKSSVNAWESLVDKVIDQLMWSTSGNSASDGYRDRPKSRSSRQRKGETMGLIASVLVEDHIGKLCRYAPSIIGPKYVSVCIVDIAGEDEPTKECPGFSFSKNVDRERVVLVPNEPADSSDSDWHVYRWGVGARWAASLD